MRRGLAILALGTSSLAAADLKPADVEFFESKIRPVLVAECYECHDAKKQKGDLRLDYRDGLLKGGEEGAAIVPGDAKKSILLQSMDHTHETLEMPKKRTKLDAQIIADFAEWINRGAPDPRTKAPEDSITPAWSDLLQVRRNWWSFQPITSPAIPAGKAASPIDRFLDAKIVAVGITPSAPADKATLLRRATYVLTGLPPSPAEIAAFEADVSPDAFAKVVDRLLASPRYGEHFARHWMDLVRYADTHGSEGDPAIPQAWRYRDYLIRAFNTDVPYDQFVREQLAGDLLRTPRLNTADKLNESSLGTGHFRMIEHGYQPVDTVDEQVRNVDNQIDVVSKTFLGLTVSCARCHDHKFDAISQADFTAFYGIFASARPGQVTVDSPEVLDRHRDRLTELKKAIRSELSAQWIRQAKDLPAALERIRASSKERVRLEDQLAKIESELSADDFRRRLKADQSAGPAPSHWWTFEQDGRDLVGKLDAKLNGGAVIKNGRLILDGQDSFAETGPTSETLTSKTLEAWVALSTLDQRGGGVVTTESIGGGAFDSLVFAERQKGRWMAGSNNSVRTQNVNGPVETTQAGDLIHLAITYQADGRIALFRNGQPYGTGYAPANEKAALHAFVKGKSRLLFGRRHTGGGNAFLSGELEEARLYGFALTAAQIADSFRAGTLRGELQPVATKSDKLDALRAQAGQLRKSIAALGAADAKLDEGLIKGKADPTHPLYASTFLRVGLKPKEAKSPRSEKPDWTLSDGTSATWRRHGNGLDGRFTPGDFRVETKGDAVLGRILPSGLHSHALSSKHSAVLTSPRFKVTTDFISVQAMGKGATLRLIPDNYPLSPGGSRFPKAGIDSDKPAWITLDTAYRKGSYAYLELTLPDDSTNPDKKAEAHLGWYGVRQVVFHTTREAGPSGEAVIVQAPTLTTVEDVTNALTEAATAWGRDEVTEAQAALLDAGVHHGMLDASTTASTKLAALIAEYRKLEAELSVPRRAPGFLEAEGFDMPLFVRGEYKQPAAIIPRRYLEVFDTKAFVTQGSGRLELADKIASADNPLTARVMTNRLWHHVFGRGLVGTVDNLGRLGEQPTHPELLDHLSKRFIQEKWSVKTLLRAMLLSEAFRRSSVPTASASAKDANNDLLSHVRVRRLEGEALRDSLITLSGRMEHRMYGPGDNAMGPPHQQIRRSVYLNIRRNSLSPLITTFDGPKPFTTIGRRDATNVPAQSLTLLNSPFVIDTAKQWARSLDPKQADAAKVDALFVQALARKATPAEQAAAMRYLADLKTTHADQPVMVWPNFAQSVLNLKEFLYLK
jgi:cytochrome c553